MAHGFVQKGTLPYFLGIAELIRKALSNNELCGPGVTLWQTMDDCALYAHQQLSSHYDHQDENGGHRAHKQTVRSVDQLDTAVEL